MWKIYLSRVNSGCDQQVSFSGVTVKISNPNPSGDKEVLDLHKASELEQAEYGKKKNVFNTVLTASTPFSSS